jgi:hypothetical protein
MILLYESIIALPEKRVNFALTFIQQLKYVPGEIIIRS